MAPAGRWYTRGGCAARTYRSAERALFLRPESVWQHRGQGPIESEPLVWDGRVLLTNRQSATRRTLTVLDLATGRPLCVQTISATLPLEPALWGDLVAVRPAPDRIEVYRIAGHRLQSVRTIRSRGPVSPPLCFEGWLYLREGDELVGYDLDRAGERWRKRARGPFRGTPSLRDGLLYALWYEPGANAHLVAVAAHTGDLEDDALAGHHDGEVPGPADDLRISILRGRAFVRHTLPVATTSGSDPFVIGVRRTNTRLQAGSGASVHDFGSEPIAWKDGWIARRDGPQGHLWMATEELDRELRSIVLADSGNHPELLATQSVTRTDDTLYLGALAVDLEDFRVLWKGATPLLPVVPAGRFLLTVTSPETLTALAEPEPRRSRAEIAALETERQVEARLAEGYASLALESVRAGDLELVRRLIGEAESRNSPARSLASAHAGLERIENGSRLPTPDRRLTQAILADERALLIRPLESMTERARETEDDELARALLRAVLERNANFEPAVQRVRALLPAEAPVTTPFDALSWLEFLAAQKDAPVTFLHPDPKAPASDGQVALLAKESRAWRSDIDGYESERLFIVTPRGRPGAVAHALRLGELVCDALESIFADAGAGRRRGTAFLPPMTLILYESRDEYIEQSQRDRSSPEVARGWTAGHYSPFDNISRMYVAEDDASYQRLFDVYAHELTHHWLATRAPFRDTRSGGMSEAKLPAYWIAEGFANLLEEFSWKHLEHTFEPRNPRANSLDTVANARPEDLLPWELVFAASKEDFLRLDARPDRALTLSWRLGARAERSELHLFYAQAGAACHWLFHGAGPRERAELLRIVQAWYEGDRPHLDLAKNLGTSSAELGRRIHAFAVEVSRGR